MDNPSGISVRHKGAIVTDNDAKGIAEAIGERRGYPSAEVHLDDSAGIGVRHESTQPVSGEGNAHWAIEAGGDDVNNSTISIPNTGQMQDCPVVIARHERSHPVSGEGNGRRAVETAADSYIYR